MAATVHALTLWGRDSHHQGRVGAPRTRRRLRVTLTWRRTDNGLLESGTVQLPTGATP